MKLWVYTGSSRIAITGEINADDLLSVASLRDALVDNEDVERLDGESETGKGNNAAGDGAIDVRETRMLSQSELAPSADRAHASKQHDVDHTCGIVDGDLFV